MALSGQDIALIITAIGVSVIPAAGTLILQIIAANRNARADVVAKNTHDLVNGMAAARVHTAEAAGIQTGIIAGLALGQTHPTPPKEPTP